MMERIEENHRHELQQLTREVRSVADRVTAGETAASALELRVNALKSAQDSHSHAAIDLQLHLEGMEDRSRRNNLQLRGLPEATGAEDLLATAIAIFRQIAGAAIPESLQIDRIHMALGPRSSDPNRP